MNHQDAKVIVDGFGLTPNESIFLRAVAHHETKYGDAWKQGKGAGSYNMGAITTNNPDSLSFKHEDSRFDEKQGKVVKYVTWFKGYQGPNAGLADLSRVLLKENVRDALSKDDIYGAVAAMYENRYFLGINREADDNIRDYYNAVSRSLTAITGATGEPYPAPLAVPLRGENEGG